MKILVIDDHEIVLGGTLHFLQQKYPEAEFISAKTALEAEEKVSLYHPNLVLMDLSLPLKPGEPANLDTGIRLLQSFLEKYPELNITVQSSFVKALVRVKSAIDNHEGGFTIADKGLSTQDMLNRVDWSLQGLTHTKELGQKIIELKPEWLKLLSFAFDKGLQDEEIAKRMNVSIRTVRHYWTKIQDVLEVYPEEGENKRIKTEIRAREKCLID